MAILLNTINMATQFQSGSEFHLITTNEIQENDYREIERSRRKFLIIFKTAQVVSTFLKPFFFNTKENFIFSKFYMFYF